jgi:uncharacterized membrane protein
MNRVLANRILFVLALAGIYVSLRLTISHLQHAPLPGCGASGGCAEVDESCWASGFCISALKAVPTAVFGLLMYIALAGLAFARAAAPEQAAQTTGRLLWALALLGSLVSLFLIYLQGYVIRSWCVWCLGSEAITFLIFLIATAERLRARLLPRKEKCPREIIR